MLELKDIGLEVDGGKRILHGIDLALSDKKIYAITGPNGSGKSTLARIIMGIEKPTTGQVFFDGTDITQKGITERANMGIGFAFQNPPRFKGIRVRDVLRLSMADKADTTRICDLLYNVGLCSQDYLDREMDASLSGGEIKRIEIASVLARDLKVAVFDEPEAGIDLWSFHRLAETFTQMHERTNTTLVIISHQERILELADEIIVMSNGGIDRSIPREQILKSGFIDDLCACRANCGIRGKDNVECVG